jgi:hypothetical protein
MPNRAPKTQRRGRTTPLLRYYGLHWDEQQVKWSGKGAAQRAVLKGKIKRDEYDFGESRGVYALFKDFHLVYVGQAFARPLGLRLREHRQDYKAGRWDTFSWFSPSILTQKGRLKELPSLKTIKPRELVDTLEAFGILIADPHLNRQRMKIPGATEVKQIPLNQLKQPVAKRDEVTETLVAIEDLVGKLRRMRP